VLVVVNSLRHHSSRSIITTTQQIINLPSTHIRHDTHQYSAVSRCFATINKEQDNNIDDEGEEDWMPPDDSPLNNKSFEKSNTTSQPFDNSTFDLPDNMEMVSPEDIPDDAEIEVIDLEATLNNKYNQQYLQQQQQQEEDLESSTSAQDLSPSEFDVEMSDVGWKEILKELRDAGNTDMINRLVNEYKLESYLEALDEEDDEEDMNNIEEDSSAALVPTSDKEDEDEWDEEFEQSLQGLSLDEVIDELIENSPSLSQLEMEILSQELDKSEQTEGEGIDYDTLDDIDLTTNSAYGDFRAMVLEDYWDRQKARGQKMIGGGGGGKKTQEADRQKKMQQTEETTTNWSTKSDFEEYPPDWKDFDSQSAFKADFSEEDDDSWDPPTSSNETTEESSGSEDIDTNNLDGTIDWLQARRTRLGDPGKGGSDGKKATHLLTPQQAETFRKQNSQIEVIPHTLFTTTEVSNSLTAQGATDIHIIDTSKFTLEHGADIGCRYIMLATGRNSSHIRVLADSVVRNLKARKLNERHVIGASLGAEGGEDIFSNKNTRNRARRNGALNTSGKIDDDWIAIDCENIHVHILEEDSRKALNIEGLWDLSNPKSDGSKLRALDLNDDDAIDTYVAENPIPDEYSHKIFGGVRSSEQWISGDAGGRVHSIPYHSQNKSYSEKWSGGKKNSSKGRRRR